MLYVVIRTDNEGNIEKVAASWNENTAEQVLLKDFNEYEREMSATTTFTNNDRHWEIIEVDEKEEAQAYILDKIKEAEEKAEEVSGAEAFADADTILKDLMDEQDWEVSGIASDLFERYKRATCKTEVEEVFQFFTCMKFKDFVEKCAKETRRL